MMYLVIVNLVCQDNQGVLNIIMVGNSEEITIKYVGC